MYSLFIAQRVVIVLLVCFIDTFTEIHPLNTTLQPPLMYTCTHRCDLVDCFNKLRATHGVRSILVEGGAGIIQSVLERELVDQVVVTIRPCYLGGYRAMSRELLQPVSLIETTAASVGGDVILYGKIQRQRDASSSSNTSSGSGDSDGRANNDGSCSASASGADPALSTPATACPADSNTRNSKNERLDVKFIGLQ
jgi:RibD C-terminal domain